MFGLFEMQHQGGRHVSRAGQDNAVLFVTLRKDDAECGWSVAASADGWEWRRWLPGSIQLGGCATRADAIARKIAFEAEIAIARRDGWA